jgi:hypothetical protein
VEKKLPQTVAALRSTYPDAKVSVWAEDEHRIGLQPVNRMVWVPRGETPIASVNLKYEWLWLIGFVEPASGETYWWIVPRLNWQILERVLADFAQAFQVSATNRILWDGPKVAQWMSSVLGRKIHPQRGWEYLKNLEMRRRRPRPAHIESDEAAQREWKKTSPDGGGAAQHLPRCQSKRLGRR